MLLDGSMEVGREGGAAGRRDRGWPGEGQAEAGELGGWVETTGGSRGGG
jgi:hypothetical protein